MIIGSHYSAWTFLRSIISCIYRIASVGSVKESFGCKTNQIVPKTERLRTRITLQDLFSLI